MTVSTRLATYGTLSPGKANHDQLANLAGRWRQGTVRGELVDEGWAAAEGFPAIVLNASSSPVEVHVFESDELPTHWERLDAFEGEGYRRVPVSVETPSGILEASIYVSSGKTA